MFGGSNTHHNDQSGEAKWTQVATDHGMSHPILKAAMYNRLEELKELVITDPRAISHREGDGWTVAHWAAQRGYEEMLSFIADRAPQLLTAQCSAGSVPAHYAAACGHNNIISLLCERDASSLMVQDNAGDTPAHDATANNKLFTLRLLVQSCPSLIYGANKKGLRPIDLAQRSEIRQFLKEAEKASMVPAVQMQNLQRESKVLTAMNAVLALYCKHYWEGEGDRADAVFSKVSADSQEFTLVTNEFGRTMSRAVISQVQRIENKALHDAFMSRRRDLKKEFGNRWSEEKHERWLFYSQSEHENVEATCRGVPGRSFQRKVGDDNSLRYGNGIYFVKEASFVDDFLAPLASGAKRQLICRVLLGDSDIGRAGLAPPLEKQSKGRGQVHIHSLADSLDDPLSFVIPEQDGNMAYPAYLVTYKM